jgi:predicted RNA-binding Zn-ribbon protein involved in translation (DUF1610 family)
MLTTENGSVCPACDAGIEPSEIVLGPGGFACPACGTQVKVVRLYGTNLTLLTFSVAALIPYTLGATGLLFIIVMLVLVFLLGAVFYAVLRSVIPPQLELTQNASVDFRGVRRHQDKP